MSIESPPALKRLDHIQALRGIAALMVVLSHLLIIERKYSADQILGDWAIYGMAGVDLFFVISGFIMVYVMWDRPRGIKAAGEFLWGRASRIYPLYWIVSLVLLVLWFVRPDMVFSSIDTPPDILKSFALFPHEREPLLAVGWTLVHEMYFYLVFAVIMLLPRKAMLPCLGVWFLIIAAYGITHIKGGGYGSPIASLVFSHLTYEFLAGAVLAWALKTGHNGRDENDLPGFENIMSYILLGLGILWLLSELSQLHDFSSNKDRGVRLALPCGFIVLGLACRDVANKAIWKPLVTLGDWSYALYLTHVLSLTLMGRIWARFKNDTLIDNVVILFTMVAVTIFISGLVYKYIERPIIKAARNTRERLFN